MQPYVYTMSRVTKVVPPKRTILEYISLSFFPVAKIGEEPDGVGAQRGLAGRFGRGER